VINNVLGQANVGGFASGVQALNKSQANINNHAADIANTAVDQTSNVTSSAVGLIQAKIQGQAASKVVEVTDSMLGRTINEYA
jgi:flagellar basal body rod protein FlgG